MKLTTEQAHLLAQAVEGHVLLTAIGSPNDIVWDELADWGYMEAADLPAGVSGACLNAWKITPAGRSALSEAEDGQGNG